MDIPNLSQTFDPNKGGLVEFGSDDRLFVQFSVKSIPNPVKSRDAGRPIYEPVTYVRIQQPAERDCIERPATQMDQRRFRRQWEAFQDGRSEEVTGSPLSVLFPNNPEIADNLKFLKIQTVEQLAELNDTQIQNVGIGGRSFVESAKQFLAAADKGKDFHALKAQVEKLALDGQAKDDRIAALENALANKDDAEPRRRPGRPTNAERQANMANQET